MLPQYSKALVDLLGQPNNIGILGYGKEGRSSYSICRALYPSVKITIFDQNQVEESDHQLDVYRTGEDYRAYLNECDVLLRSPGIKLTASEFKGKVTSQVDLFTQLCRDRIVGVTGTKGKSTTTTLIQHLLSQKYKTALVGNIGTPVLESLSENYDFYVCEYSCHQLSDITASPKYAVLLNLFPEHLDYYETVEEYYATKANIYNHQKHGDKVYSIDRLVNGAEVVSLGTKSNINGKCIHSSGSVVAVGGKTIELSGNLTGDHNKLNQLFAVTLAVELGVESDQIAAGLETFMGLPHRLETVYQSGNLRFVNDSISTIPQSTLAAMSSYDDLHLVLIGGYDRGIDYSPLIEYLNSGVSCRVVLFSQVGRRISESVTTSFELAADFAAAVNLVLAQKEKSGTILMSPGASSYDEFKSFVHRGNYFRDRVQDHYRK